MSDDLRWALAASEAALRDVTTRIAVRDGYACPEPGCGLYYRHTHDDLWWPPEGSSPPVSREATERWFRERKERRA